LLVLSVYGKAPEKKTETAPHHAAQLKAKTGSNMGAILGRKGSLTKLFGGAINRRIACRRQSPARKTPAV
jgi:hypothetical protein